MFPLVGKLMGLLLRFIFSTAKVLVDSMSWHYLHYLQFLLLVIRCRLQWTILWTSGEIWRNLVNKQNRYALELSRFSHSKPYFGTKRYSFCQKFWLPLCYDAQALARALVTWGSWPLICPILVAKWLQETICSAVPTNLIIERSESWMLLNEEVD